MRSRCCTTRGSSRSSTSRSSAAMMSKAWCARHGVERAQDFNGKQETFAVRNANGTGPFRLDRYEPDTKTVLKAHPAWWGRKDRRTGNVDEAVYVSIRSDATRLA